MATLFGTGIAYLGKTEIWIRLDKCPHCGARGQLAHYTAGKHLKIAGISLFSTGNVRIEDECRMCKRFRVVAYKDWEARRDQVMEQRLRALEQRPNDIAEALDFLEAVQRYSCLDPLQEEAPGLADRFAQESHVLLMLGNAYSYFGEWEQAEAFFEAAESSVELECFRAIDLLRRGSPAEAEPKLEPVFQERLENYRGSLYLLAEGYQNRGQRDKAEKALLRIESTWPSQAFEPEHKWLLDCIRGRKHIPALALKRSLPKSPWFAHPIVYGTLLPSIFCYALATVWAAQNREIYLINGTDAPYDVEVAGKRRTLVPGIPELATIAEGSVDYKITDSSVPSGQVSIHTPWPLRAFQKRTFVLNPDGLALLHTERAGYSQPPRDDLDNQFQFYPLQRLHEFPDVDLPFEDFPITIQVSHGQLDFLYNPVTYLRRLDVVPGGPSQLLDLVAEDKETGRKYLENALGLMPSQELIEKAEESMGAEALLDAASGHLDAVPVETAWHLLYQDLAWSNRNLDVEYQERLSKSPKDPELQFLLARVTGNWQLVKDKPVSQFAQLREAQMALAVADFAGAERLSRSQTPALRAIYASSLLAQGRYKELSALPLDDTMRLFVLQASGQSKEAEHHVKVASPTQKEVLALYLAYAEGQPCQKSFDDDDKLQMMADLYAGKFKEVQPLLKESASWKLHLTVYLATRDKQELARAIDTLGSYPPFSARFQAAELLRHPDPKVLELSMVYNEKRLILAALCLIDPQHREVYRPLASKLNFEKSFPYWTVQKVLARP